ncbi:MAG: hypothetical protein KZQ81_16035 [Candidatus Thiodiazotropha sp. (ex Rostrolucina anterorostrata)]|jgi:hypothetical protein|nr:hypothetical protein [Candidatus Thiodiazotropha sp. (ex Rostrolucina anterorostrata)]
MKCIHLPSVPYSLFSFTLFSTLFVILGGCSTHFYTFDENEMTIYLKQPKAQTILFACSLDGYEGRQLKQQSGLWEVRLPAGESFNYFYMVDGEIFIPQCPLQENNDFGSKNCIFEPNM